MTASLQVTLEALQSTLEELEGVPRKITSDNPKALSLKADKYEPLLNPAYELWGAYYSLLIECLPPRAPQLKGKVER